MSRQIGKPYDPALRQTMHGACLYSMWRKVRKHPHDKAWDYFPAFYEWAMSSGYKLGSVLRRADEDKPFNPGNCIWKAGAEKNKQIPAEWAQGWNRTVNRIREHYGMPLIGVSEDGK